MDNLTKENDFYKDILLDLEILETKVNKETDKLKLYDLATELIPTLDKLSDTNIYNFKRDLDYHSLKEEGSYINTQLYKEQILKYIEEAKNKIILYLADLGDPVGIQKLLKKIEPVFLNSSFLQNNLKESFNELQKLKEENKNISNIKKEAEESKGHIDAYSQQTKANEEKLNTLNETIDKLSSKTALFEGIKSFQTLSDSYKNSAKWWLAGIIGAGLIIVSYLIVIMNKYYEIIALSKVIDVLNHQNINPENVFYIAFAKMTLTHFLLLTILIIFLNYTIKNYKASMHNSIICGHKASSLEAAKKLIDHSGDADIKHYILATAATSIFTHQSTGYSEMEKSNMEGLALGKLFEKFNPIGNKEN